MKGREIEGYPIKQGYRISGYLFPRILPVNHVLNLHKYNFHEIEM